MEDLPRVEVVPFAVIRIQRVAFIAMAGTALLKLPGIGQIFDRMVTAGAGDSGAGFVRVSRIGVDGGLVLFVIEEDESAAAVQVESNWNSLSLRRRHRSPVSKGRRESSSSERKGVQQQNDELQPHRMRRL
jgi:hypothetical protein